MRPEDQLWEEPGTATLGHGYKGTGAAGGAEETARSWNPGALSAGLTQARAVYETGF